MMDDLAGALRAPWMAAVCSCLVGILSCAAPAAETRPSEPVQPSEASPSAAPVAPAPQLEPKRAMMKAIRIHAVGDADVMQQEEIPRPEPKAGELLVRVIAAGVNPVDAKMRQATRKDLRALMESRLPFVLGLDVAGVVTQVGEGVSRFKQGDAVYAFLDQARGGGYAEYAIVKEGEAALKPASLSFKEAAAVPLAGLTAWQGLFETASLEKGQTVLIQGASGGVGVFAVQLAKARGARVLATASTRNQELLRELGADLAIDYTRTSFDRVVRNVDVVLDNVGGDTTKRSIDVVRRGGFLATLLEAPDAEALKKRGIQGARVQAHPDAATLEKMTALIEEKKVRPLVSETLPLSEVRTAHEMIATRHTRGKIVLVVAEEP
ncbi:NADP-dependent oxidoreductase [Chondromyces crocatus]|uniref:NADPH:quinone reductase n=1 Tax=Chondromyces crocatus TaxID=52 RepID=A0A0K1ENP3_CHOCO|nr:NADP-dependent oxidoreductase [Chondromyces crocatus]AKT42459.1 NADPH:quinone reductase [Chondromyces crocatus]